MKELKIAKENLFDPGGKVFFKFPQPVLKAIFGEEKVYVLLEGYTRDPAYAPYIRTNIWCIGVDGKKIWETEELKTGTKYDCYSNLVSEGDKIFGISGSGFKVEIDKNTGKILDAEFLK